MKSTMHVPAKVAHWSAHIKKWKRSGLLQKDYCAQQGLHVKSFGYWKRALGYGTSARVTKDDNGTAMPKQLIPVSILGDEPAESNPARGQAENAGIRLHIQDKYAIDLAIGFHAATLQQLLGILG